MGLSYVAPPGLPVPLTAKDVFNITLPLRDTTIVMEGGGVNVGQASIFSPVLNITCPSTFKELSTGVTPVLLVAGPTSPSPYTPGLIVNFSYLGYTGSLQTVAGSLSPGLSEASSMDRSSASGPTLTFNTPVQSLATYISVSCGSLLGNVTVMCGAGSPRVIQFNCPVLIATPTCLWYENSNSVSSGGSVSSTATSSPSSNTTTSMWSSKACSLVAILPTGFKCQCSGVTGLFAGRFAALSRKDTDVFFTMAPTTDVMVAGISWALLAVVIVVTVGAALWTMAGYFLDVYAGRAFLRALRKDREVAWLLAVLPPLGYESTMGGRFLASSRRSAKVAPLLISDESPSGENGLESAAASSGVRAWEYGEDDEVDEVAPPVNSKAGMAAAKAASDTHPLTTALRIRMSLLVSGLATLPAAPGEIAAAAAAAATSTPAAPGGAEAAGGDAFAVTSPEVPPLDPFLQELSYCDAAISRTVEEEPQLAYLNMLRRGQLASNLPTSPLKGSQFLGSSKAYGGKAKGKDGSMAIPIPPTPGSRLAELSVASLTGANAAKVKRLLSSLAAPTSAAAAAAAMAALRPSRTVTPFQGVVKRTAQVAPSGVAGSDSSGAPPAHHSPESGYVEPLGDRFKRLSPMVARVGCMRAWYLNPLVSPFLLFIPHQSRALRTLYLHAALIGPLWLIAYCYTNLWWTATSPLLPPITSPAQFLALCFTAILFSFLLLATLHALLLHPKSAASKAYLSHAFPLLVGELQRRGHAEALFSRVPLNDLRGLIGGGSGRYSSEEDDFNGDADDEVFVKEDDQEGFKESFSAPPLSVPSLPDDFDTFSRTFPQPYSMAPFYVSAAAVFVFIAFATSYTIIFALTRGNSAAITLLAVWGLSTFLILFVFMPLATMAHTLYHLVLLPHATACATANPQSGWSTGACWGRLTREGREARVGGSPRYTLSSRLTLEVVPMALTLGSGRSGVYSVSPAVPLMLTVPLHRLAAVLEAPLFSAVAVQGGGWKATLDPHFYRAALTRRAYITLLLGFNEDRLRKERLAIIAATLKASAKNFTPPPPPPPISNVLVKAAAPSPSPAKNPPPPPPLPPPPVTPSNPSAPSATPTPTTVTEDARPILSRTYSAASDAEEMGTDYEDSPPDESSRPPSRVSLPLRRPLLGAATLAGGFGNGGGSGGGGGGFGGGGPSMRKGGGSASSGLNLYDINPGSSRQRYLAATFPKRNLLPGVGGDGPPSSPNPSLLAIAPPALVGGAVPRAQLSSGSTLTNSGRNALSQSPTRGGRF